MIREQEYRITENDSNVTSSAGVIGTMTDIETFTCPASTAFVIRPGDVFSLYADASGTEVADSTSVELEIRDSNNITRNTIITANYAVIKEFQDRQKIYIFGQSYSILANQQLVIRANSASTITAANTLFQISSVRGSSTLF